MLKIFKTNIAKKKLEQVDEISPDSWIDLVTPTEKEIDQVIEKTGIDRDLIMKMLDDDELPRVETEGNATLIVIDVPIYNLQDKNITNPLGIIITTNNFLVTISPKNTSVLNAFRVDRVKDFRTAKKSRFLMQILFATAEQYIKVLDEVYRDIEAKEATLKKSTKNEDLIDLLSVEKTLVYFASSLRSNDLVLERLSKGLVVPLYDGDLNMLEDAMIENRQAIEMAKIYRNILSSITNTYATVISNNLNNVMKFLAGITIVLSIPTIISSFLGMNVPFGIIGESPYSAEILLAVSFVASISIAWWLKRRGML